MRLEAEHAEKLAREAEITRAQAQASQMILAFLEFMIVRRGDKAAAAIKGSST